MEGWPDGGEHCGSSPSIDSIPETSEMFPAGNQLSSRRERARRPAPTGKTHLPRHKQIPRLTLHK